MPEASANTIKRLIEISEKGLVQIERSLPFLMKTRQAVLCAIKKQEGKSNILDLMLTTLDTLLAEDEVVYDLSSLLDALLRATDDYTKRYYMQGLNFCFWETCQLFVGEGNDEDGLLTKLKNLTKQHHQAGCQLLIQHIIDDIQEFRNGYCDKSLRNITRHYDDPIVMYEKQIELNDIDLFARGVSQLIAIRMEVSVLTSYLMSMLFPIMTDLANVPSDTIQTVSRRVGSSKLDLRSTMNDVLFKAFRKKDVREEVQMALSNGHVLLEKSYRLFSSCLALERVLKEHNILMPNELDKIKYLIKMRMEAQFLRYDVACSIWGYLNSFSDKERSQNLRLIYITKQAALTHIYGYTDDRRDRSLWAAITKIEESDYVKLEKNSVEKRLKELTTNLDEDNETSRKFAHYRYKHNFYIPSRLESFNKMVHYKELKDAIKLLKICKLLEIYIADLLHCIDDRQRQSRKKKHDEWRVMIDDLKTKGGDIMKITLKPMMDLIDKIYGE